MMRSFAKTATVLFVVLIINMAGSQNVRAGHGAETVQDKPVIPGGDLIDVSGLVHDHHQEPVDGSEVVIRVNGKDMDRVETVSNGEFISRFMLEKGVIESATLEIVARKTSFKPQIVKITGDHFAQRGNHYLLSQDIVIFRAPGPAFWISTIIFVLAYVLIAFELLHRTVAAMLGAALMLLISYTIGTLNPDFHIFSFEVAVHAIDMNVVFLLMGMMIIVGVLKHTGVFQWCAYISYRMARGNVFLLMVYLIIFTAACSAFLDNVTTMLLLTGVAIEIAVSLAINPLFILIPLVLSSNIGGTATLIGDPPNIMIGSYAGLSFMDFVMALALVCVVSLIVLLVFTRLIWGKAYASANIQNVEQFVQELKNEYRITDPKLLVYGLGVLGFAVFLFLSHGYWHMEVSIAAVMGAAVLLTIAILTDRIDLIELIEKDIEWPTLMFFIFLFMLVGAVEETGLLALIADWILNLSKGNFMAACALILWVAAIMSAFVDNIPFTATMLPIVAYLSTVITGAENTLWWALALGACFGGNGTIIGASANVVTLGIAEARGYRITFLGFMKTAFPFMIITVLIAHIWLVIFRPN